MRRLLPPNLALLCIAGMLVLHVAAPVWVVLSGAVRFVGVAPLVLGLGLAIAGSRQFGRVGTNIKTFDRPDVLVTEGLFRYSRNPMYVGLNGLVLGVAMLLGTLTPFGVALLFFVATARWYIPFEEAALRETFGEAYDAYCARVRRWV